MARPSSIALAGYFPTPAGQLPSLASLVEFIPQRFARHVLLDPCAGDASAIAALRDLWFTRPVDKASIFALELETERAEGHKLRLIPSVDTSLHCDAFHVRITPCDGASLLFLNPPYDADKVHRRLEQRFLHRWTQALEPGTGILMFLVPYYALGVSASHLASQYEDIRAWRFPAPEFDRFRQCVLVARRRSTPLPDNPFDQKRIERWAADASSLPELRLFSKAPFRVKSCEAGLRLEVIPLDLDPLLSAFRPWYRSPYAGLNRDLHEMIGAKFPVAQPPRPAHIALALSVGALNGKVLTPNSPGLPSLLVKGSFVRNFEPLDERFDEDGNKTGTVLVQRPRLTICVLRLDTFEFLTLRPGSTPSGAQDLPHFNTADLVECYGKSLSRLMRDQFPALHDPADPSHNICLPTLAREPLRTQRAAISTGLKLLATGENPQAVAEVGTGKSTVALSILGALSPHHFHHTTSELKRLSFDTSRLSPVKRALIVCPPHLLKSWHDQVAAVLPDARVVTVEGISDLRRDADIYVLSREVAKLGHGVIGVGERSKSRRRPVCPQCASPLLMSPSQLAQTRVRCSFVARVPQNEEARAAEDLAAALIPTFPLNGLVRSLVSRHRILSLLLPQEPVDEADPDAGFEAQDDADLEASPAPLPRPDLLHHIARGLLQLALQRAFLDPQLSDVIHTLCHAAGLHAEASELLQRRAELLEGQPHPSYRHAQDLDGLARSLRSSPTEPLAASDLLSALNHLSGLGRWKESTPCGEFLYQATPEPRRFPLARYILRYCRHLFDLLVVDEWHEYSKKGSAQQKAAHRLVELPGVPTIVLTGSLMGGYASSLFANFWALSPRFRAQFGPTDQQAFITAFGYRKIYVPAGQEDVAPELVAYGSVTDREETRDTQLIRQLGQAPGVLPSFILSHLLPVALVMHKEDLDDELPKCNEIAVPVSVQPDDVRGQELLAEYRRLLSLLINRIKADRFDKDLAGKLWGGMSELPSYLDRCTSDLPPFVLRYPEEVGAPTIATAKMFPSTWVTPKEKWLVDRVRASLEQRRNVLIFLRHTGDKNRGLPTRYARLLEDEIGYRTVFLDVQKVKAAQREQWLDDNVIRPRRRILITNPKAVQTGLNNLVHFSAAIWPQGLDFDARVVRQANGRVHRIGQNRDVSIDIPYYSETVQKTALDLVIAKISSSLQVDGLSIDAALESAGATADEDEAAKAAMNIGRAIYEAWAGRLSPTSTGHDLNKAKSGGLSLVNC